MEDKYFRRYRNLGRIAFYCTVAITLAILLSSFMGPGSSGKITRFFESIVLFFQPEADIEHNVCSGIEVSIVDDKGESKHYVGSVSTVVVTPIPADAEIGEIVLSSGNPLIASVEGNKVYYHTYGVVDITVSLKDNPTIAKTVTTRCEGKDPVVQPELSVDASTKSVKVGGRTTVKINGSVMSSAKVQIVDDPNGCIKVISNKYIFGLKAGTATVNITVAGKTFVEEIKISANPDFVLPQTVSVYESVTVWPGERINYSKLIQGIAAEKDFYFTLKIVDGYPSDVVSVSSDKTYVTAKNIGATRLQLTSVFNPDCYGFIDVNVVQQPPEDMIIVGAEYVSIYGKNDSYTLRDHNGRDISNDAITWEIVSGKATVDGEGVVTVNGFRKVVIRATTVVDGFTMVTEKTVKVRLYDDFYGFMRKIAGHFTVFAVLGFGVLATTTILIKRKWLVPIITLAYNFAIAGLSEVFQLPIFVSGRCCSFTDVLVDFGGSLVGCCAFTAAFVIFIAVLALILKKDKFKSFVRAARAISLKDVFINRKP